MNETTLDVLMHRLDRLERANGRLRRAGVLVLAGLVAVVLMGQALPKNRTVEAETFVAKDSSGRVRAILGAARSRDGEPEHGLFLYGATGKDRARLATWGGGTQLVLYDYEEHIASVASLDAMGKFAGLSLDSAPHRAEEPSEGFAELTVGMGASSFAIGGLTRPSNRSIVSVMDLPSPTTPMLSRVARY